MGSVDLYAVGDAGVLRKLDGGLEIIRRKKHEWRKELNEVSQERLKILTGKKWGSKFLPAWTLERVVDLIAMHVQRAGWTDQSGAPQPLDVHFGEPIGLADGLSALTIRIVSDGRYVHAYPIKD